MEKEVKFALRLGRAITAKLDYIAQYYGRSRASEINWAIRRHISSFEKEFGKIPLWKKLNHPARGDFFGIKGGCRAAGKYFSCKTLDKLL